MADILPELESFASWPAKYQTAAILYSQGMTIEDISQHLGIKRQTLSRTINHGNKWFSPLDFQEAARLLGEKYGVLSRMLWGKEAQKAFRKALEGKMSEDLPPVVELVQALLGTATEQPRASLALALEGDRAISPEFIREASGLLRSRCLEARAGTETEEEEDGGHPDPAPGDNGSGKG